MVLITLNERLFQRLKMPQLNVKSSYTFLNLQLLLLGKLILTDYINNISILHILVYVDDCRPRRHLDSIGISLSMLIFTQQRVILWIHAVSSSENIDIFINVGFIRDCLQHLLHFPIVCLHLLSVCICILLQILRVLRDHRSL